MRILISSVGVYEKKGFDRNLSLAKGLVELGNEVTLLTCNNNFSWRKEKRFGVEIVAVPEIFNYRLSKGGLGIFDTLSRIIYMSNKSYDVIHVDVGFRPSGGIPGHLFAKLKNIAYVCDWWDWIGKGGNLDGRSWLYRHTLGASDSFFEEYEKYSADGIITISECLQQRAVSLGIDKEKTVIIHGGSDMDGVEYVDKITARNELGLDLETPLLGYVGMGPFECDDLEPFLMAMPSLKKKWRNLKWFSTGGVIPDLLREKYSIGDEYIELGWVGLDDYKKYLQAADILLLPLRDNTVSKARWPNKMGDYIAAGRPVITTDIGEISRFNSLYPGGVVLAEWESKSFETSIDELLSSPAKMEEMGRYNFDVARKHYSWMNKSKEFYEFYLKVCGMRSS